MTGPVVIVTGSATGVGAAVARRLAGRGARVVINYSRSRAEAERTLADCASLAADFRSGSSPAVGDAEDTGPLLVRADIARDDDCRRLAAAALQRWGRIDGLVNNAATTRSADPFDLESLSPEDFRQVLDVNLVGTWQMIRAVVPAMRAAGGGSIVNVSSSVAVTGGGSSLAYTASKGGLNALTLALARTLGPAIRVNAVCPGVIDSRWMPAAVGAEAFDALARRFEQSAPLGRIATPDDIAEPIVWLLEGAGYVTGELMMLDGGMRLSGGGRRPAPPVAAAAAAHGPSAENSPSSR